MQTPTEWDQQQLKRAVRYLAGLPRLVQRFESQSIPAHVTVSSDSDHAGCLKTRKSTTGVFLFYGKHLIRSSSTTQGVVALSSGEAEFYAMVKGTSAGLGVEALLRDAGAPSSQPLQVTVDATAGIGIASRKGAGRIRHIATPTLWMQRLVNDGSVVLTKVLGTQNPADLGTKPLDGPAIRRVLARCGFTEARGASKLALRAALAST